jgi:hypothetical protein
MFRIGRFWLMPEPFISLKSLKMNKMNNLVYSEEMIIALGLPKTKHKIE